MPNSSRKAWPSAARRDPSHPSPSTLQLHREEEKRAELERELNDWLLQYVVALDSASASTRLRYPLRGARAQLHDVEGDPGWYRMEVRLLPHLKYMAQAFTISVVGKVEAR